MIITCPSCRHPLPDRAASLGSAGPDGALLAAAASAGSSSRSPSARRRRSPWWRSRSRWSAGAAGRGARRQVGLLLASLRAAAGRGRRRPQRDRRPVAGDRAALPATRAVAGAAVGHGVPRAELAAAAGAGPAVLVVTGEIAERLRPAARRAADPRRPARRRSARARFRPVRPARSRRSGLARRHDSRSSSAPPPPEASDFTVSFGAMR